MSVTNGKRYWAAAPGQIGASTSVDSRHDTQEDAEKAAKKLFSYGIVAYAKVRYIRIIEHDIPTDDPAFNQNDAVENKYWCVVAPKIV